MKRLKTMLFFVLSLAVSFASHADNKITFTGKVIDSACKITVNGGTSSLDLGETAATDIAAKGQTGAPKTFAVSLAACPAAGAGVPTKAYVKFSGTTDGDDTYFKNDLTENAATNVAVQIKDASGKAIANNDGNNAIVLPTAGGDLNLEYTASLVASAATPTKGDVSATVTYTVSYE
ncbi:fimbrial protein [Enterobacter roggenkampii]|uniref:fimbrial protein n=1 Tax=Enterobacter roggenkampii TaxID=1812935 RepID=UPI0032AEC93F